jgi:hypothetical protein
METGEIYRGWHIKIFPRSRGWSFRVFPPDDDIGESDEVIYSRQCSATAAARLFVMKLSASVALMQFLDDAYAAGLIADEERWILIDSLP